MCVYYKIHDVYNMQYVMYILQDEICDLYIRQHMKFYGMQY